MPRFLQFIGPAVFGFCSKPGDILEGKALSLRNALQKTDDPPVVLVLDIPQTKASTEFLCLALRSEEHTSELQSLMRNSYAVFCMKKKKHLLQTQNMTTS